MHAAAGTSRPATASDVRARYLEIARARLALNGAVGASASALTPGNLAIAGPVDTGHGHPDVAVLTLPLGAPSTLSLRDGATGRQRWRRSVGDAWGFDTARLGPRRRPAIVVYTTSFLGTGGSDPTGAEDTGSQSTSIIAIDAGSGATIWTSPAVVGTYSVTDAGFTEADALYPAGVLRDRGGDRLLAVEVSQSFDLMGLASEARAVVYEGTSGTSSTVGPPVAGDDIAMATPAGDLDADGVTDWYTSVGGDAGAVTASSGATGEPIWTQPAPEAGELDLRPVGDLDSDGTPDVVVSAQGGVVSADGIVTAYSGKAGTALFSRAGMGADPLGTVHGRPAIAVWGNFSFDGVHVAGVAGDGRTLWQQLAPFPSGNGGGSITFGAARDVDADHVDDLFIDIAWAGEGFISSTTTVVSGRTGQAARGRNVGLPVGFSLDGHGCDFIAVGGDEHHWKVTAYDGNSRRVLWKLDYPVSSKSFLLALSGAALGRSAGQSIVASLWSGRSTHVLVIRGSNGHITWDVAA